uniref:Uncharacterized protein n=1 Tax=Oryza brachyantha TaxID=4533 RepID=J3KUU1_ORYBR
MEFVCCGDPTLRLAGVWRCCIPWTSGMQDREQQLYSHALLATVRGRHLPISSEMLVAALGTDCGVPCHNVRVEAAAPNDIPKEVLLAIPNSTPVNPPDPNDEIAMEIENAASLQSPPPPPTKKCLDYKVLVHVLEVVDPSPPPTGCEAYLDLMRGDDDNEFGRGPRQNFFQCFPGRVNGTRPTRGTKGGSQSFGGSPSGTARGLQRAPYQQHRSFNAILALAELSSSEGGHGCTRGPYLASDYSGQGHPGRAGGARNCLEQESAAVEIRPARPPAMGKEGLAGETFPNRRHTTRSGPTPGICSWCPIGQSNIEGLPEASALQRLPVECGACSINGRGRGALMTLVAAVAEVHELGGVASFEEGSSEARITAHTGISPLLSRPYSGPLAAGLLLTYTCRRPPTAQMKGPPLTAMSQTEQGRVEAFITQISNSPPPSLLGQRPPASVPKLQGRKVVLPDGFRLRRSSWIEQQGGGARCHSISKAQKVVTKKMGLIAEEEEPNQVAVNKYVDLFDELLSSQHVTTLAALLGLEVASGAELPIAAAASPVRATESSA